MTPLSVVRLLGVSEVPYATRELVQRALAVAQARLGLPKVTVRWYAADYPYLGFTSPDEPDIVWLSAALASAAPRTVAEVAGHECRHLRQFLDGRPRDELSSRLDEHRALLFGVEVAEAVPVGAAATALTPFMGPTGAAAVTAPVGPPLPRVRVTWCP